MRIPVPEDPTGVPSPEMENLPDLDPKDKSELYVPVKEPLIGSESETEEAPPGPVRRSKRKGAAETIEKMRQRTLRTQYNQLVRDRLGSTANLADFEFQDELDVTLTFVAYEYLLFKHPLTALRTVSKDDYIVNSDARDRVLQRVQHIFEKVHGGKGPIPFPWDKINAILHAKEHDLLYDMDIFELDVEIPFNQKTRFEDVAGYYGKYMNTTGNEGKRRQLANYEPEMDQQCLSRQKRMVEVCAIIAYNDFVKDPENLYLGLSPKKPDLEFPPQRISEIERSLWGLFDFMESDQATEQDLRDQSVETVEYVEELEKVKEATKTLADKVEILMAESVTEPPTGLPTIVEEPPQPATVVRFAPSTFGKVDQGQNMGWAMGIGLALTFAFLAQGLND